MNKQELIDNVSRETNCTKVDCIETIDTLLTTIKKNVKKGNDVKIIGFGTFTKLKRKARMGVNPQTKKSIKIPASWVPKFRAGTEFKKSL